jgi:hypothetical protein
MNNNELITLLETSIKLKDKSIILNAYDYYQNNDIDLSEDEFLTWDQLIDLGNDILYS